MIIGFGRTLLLFAITLVLLSLTWNLTNAPIRWLLGICVFLAICLVVVAEQWIHQKKRGRLSNREELTIDDLYSKRFNDSSLSKEELVKFLTIIARKSDQRIGQLRPQDRLDEELGPVHGWEWDDGMFAIPYILKDQFGGTLDDYDFDKHETLGDLLSTVEKVLEQKECVDKSAM